MRGAATAMLAYATVFGVLISAASAQTAAPPTDMSPPSGPKCSDCGQGARGGWSLEPGDERRIGQGGSGRHLDRDRSSRSVQPVRPRDGRDHNLCRNPGPGQACPPSRFSIGHDHRTATLRDFQTRTILGYRTAWPLAA